MGGSDPLVTIVIYLFFLKEPRLPKDKNNDTSVTQVNYLIFTKRFHTKLKFLSNLRKKFFGNFDIDFAGCHRIIIIQSISENVVNSYWKVFGIVLSDFIVVVLIKKAFSRVVYVNLTPKLVSTNCTHGFCPLKIRGAQKMSLKIRGDFLKIFKIRGSK